MTAVADGDCGLSHHCVAVGGFDQQVAAACCKVYVDAGIRAVHQHPAATHSEVGAGGFLYQTATRDANQLCVDLHCGVECARNIHVAHLQGSTSVSTGNLATCPINA